jgi:hypothetical protein
MPILFARQRRSFSDYPKETGESSEKPGKNQLPGFPDELLFLAHRSDHLLSGKIHGDVPNAV